MKFFFLRFGLEILRFNIIVKIRLLQISKIKDFQLQLYFWFLQWFRVLGFWGLGLFLGGLVVLSFWMLVFWGAGLVGCWVSQVFAFWGVGVLGWCFFGYGVLGFWDVMFSGWWVCGIWGVRCCSWSVGMMKFGFFGFLEWSDFGLLGIWFLCVCHFDAGFIACWISLGAAVALFLVLVFLDIVFEVAWCLILGVLN